MNNHKQLTRAWRLYADENNGKLVGAADWTLNGSQVPGWMSNHWMDVANPTRDDNWDADKWIKTSRLYSYTSKSPVVFKCPADNTTGIRNGKRVPRIRSMSMNNWVGGPAWGDSGPGWRTYTQESDMGDPAPAMVWVLMDEREDGINDGYFIVDMASYPNSPYNIKIVAYPASYHNKAAGVSFADGHSEIRKWRDPRTTPPIKKGNPLQLNIPSPNKRRYLDAGAKHP
ncbi:MAG: prepilin-type N-terminal cleavage/methylation domain-containing protein [Limisphaerales bacterium]